MYAVTVLPVAASDLVPPTPAPRDEVRSLLPKRCALVALAPAPVAPIARAHAEDVIVKPAQVANAINANKNAA